MIYFGSSRTLNIQGKGILNNDAVPAIDVAGIAKSTEEIKTEIARESLFKEVNQLTKRYKKLTVVYNLYIFGRLFIVKQNHRKNI